jgi:hemin uptake protein HemP
MNKKISEPIASAANVPCTRPNAAQAPRPRLHSKELFGTAHEIVIEHAGDEYRLRLTRQGKLILTK